MLKLFRQLQDRVQANDAGATPRSDQELHLAAAALMVEVACVDHKADRRELKTIGERLQQQLGLDAATVDTLIDEAQEQQASATSLYQFTRLINDHFSAQEKIALIKDMWAVAYADHKIDKYEEYIIRRVAELIHVSHSDFIRSKIAVREAQGAR